MSGQQPPVAGDHDACGGPFSADHRISIFRHTPVLPEFSRIYRLLFLAALAAAVSPLHAQSNPFKMPKAGVKAAQVTYSLTGDITGTATVAIAGDRVVRRQTSTMKMMGKTVSTDSWTLSTPDSTYNADLTKKQGLVIPTCCLTWARPMTNSTVTPRSASTRTWRRWHHCCRRPSAW